MIIYNSLEEAFNFYNKSLFNGILPTCVISFCRNKRIKGYFITNKYINYDKTEEKHEIAINPMFFGVFEDIKVLSTLVHEMCHMYLEIQGHKTKKGYHDLNWAKFMEGIGLMPSHNGNVGGKKVGYKMTHYIISGGLFEKATNQLLAKGFKINWMDKYPTLNLNKNDIKDIQLKSLKNKLNIFFNEKDNNNKTIEIIRDLNNEEIIKEKKIEKKGGVRKKYSCQCSNIWGKSGLTLHCNKCNSDFIEEEN